MRVICLKNSKRLIKGCTYTIDYMFNNTHNRYNNGYLGLEEITGSHSVNNFTDMNGNPLPNIDTTKDRVNYKLDVKSGDILECIVDRYKTLLKGGYYKIESIDKHKSVKFVGLSRKILINYWNFRKLSTSEVRDLQLNDLLKNIKPNIVQTSKIDKLKLSGKSDIILMETLSKSILDVNRHYYSILEWGIQKNSGSYKIKKEDYNKLLDMKLSDILKLIEK